MARILLRVLVVAVSVSFAAAFSLAAVRTALGPRPADPVEQSILDQAKRFARHDLAIAEPARAGAPRPMPGFAAAVAVLVGVDVPRLELVRVLALTATLFTALLLLFLVHYETESWTLALAAASTFLFGQGVLATAPGVARPEALLFLLVLLAFGALRLFVGVAGSILAGVLLAAAWLVDAGALVFLAAALVSQALDEKRRLGTLAVAALLGIAAGTIGLMPRLGPGFSEAAWIAPLERVAYDPRAGLAFLTATLVGKLGLFTLAAVLSCALVSSPWRDREGLWIWLGVAAIAAGAFATQGGGSGEGALAFCVAALALVGTLALQRVVRQLAERTGDGPAGESVILVALVLQFVVIASSAVDAAWVRGIVRPG